MGFYISADIGYYEGNRINPLDEEVDSRPSSIHVRENGKWVPGQPPVPDVVDMRRARHALLQAGILDQVNAAIAGMPGIEGEAARIDWEFASTVERSSPLVKAMSVALSLSDAQLDQLFRVAGGL